ncbi:penicillin acylase family protein [uncultured Microscilla sp.]|uniref:penicillin acylase family protein n=1 Tax=uncultured Microscilla sp. TaxID=432653 RepID=UPI002627AB1D|nr:penicillin acylase family protein [uncultured Microscilla sp.]
MKWFVRSLLIILILVMLAVGGVYFFLQSTKPKYTGKITLEGLQKTAKIHYDKHGVPHIGADNMEDAYFALGYAHAQDRLFQMDLMKRMGSGRLSEFFGKKTIETDRLMRTLGIAENAKASAAEFRKNPDAPHYKATMAYIAGVNQFIKKGKAPAEYTILGVEREELTLEHVYHILGYMGFSFATGHRTDPLLTELNKKLGAKYLKDLRIDTADDSLKIPTYNPSGNDSLPNVNTGGIASAIHDIVQQMPVATWFGSNSWVVSGKLTQSGKVLLANDTHIKYAQPSVWFEAHIEYPGFSFYGNHLAGIPFGIVGHTRHHAWGLTMLENDDIDFYTEKLNPQNSNQVWATNKWESLKIRYEVIKVKGGDNIRIRVKTSRHGPIINDVLVNKAEKETAAAVKPKKEKKKGEEKDKKAKKTKLKAPKLKIGKKKKDKKEDKQEDKTDTTAKSTKATRPLPRYETPISVYWTFTKFKNKSLEALFNLSHSKSMREVERAVSTIHAPGLNLMYGDKQGNIAWWAVAKLIKRRDSLNSKFFMDGASGKDEPLGFYKFEENPRSINPPSGFVFSANNQPEKMSDGIYYPGYYVPDHRAKRIKSWLTRTQRWNMSKMQVMITDGISAAYPHLSREFAQVLEKDVVLKTSAKKQERYQEAIAQLKDWKGEHTLESVAPTIYYKMLSHVLHKTLKDEMGTTNFNTFMGLFVMRRTIPYLMQNKNSLWWDNATTLTSKETRADIFREAFVQTMNELEQQLGKKVAKWHWKKMHTLEHKHPLGKGGFPLNRMFDVGPYAVMGGLEVINNQAFKLDHTAKAMKVKSGPAMRLIVDFGNIDKSVSMLPTGQSGNFMSPYYSDQTELFNSGRFRETPMISRDSIQKMRRRKVLVLKPRK